MRSVRLVGHHQKRRNSPLLGSLLGEDVVDERCRLRRATLSHQVDRQRFADLLFVFDRQGSSIGLLRHLQFTEVAAGRRQRGLHLRVLVLGSADQ